MLFIMVTLGTTIFFCHSLIRLCMLILHPEADRPAIPNMAGPDGIHPEQPIRVHLARDEELGGADAASDLHDAEKPPTVAMPPPAYGLWRSSVRVDPNLLHWQRADAVPGAESPALPRARNDSAPGEQDRARGHAQGQEQSGHREEHVGPRPPSYVSDDGVEYVVSAAPRSTAPSHTGLSDVHPAWRPGFAV